MHENFILKNCEMNSKIGVNFLINKIKEEEHNKIFFIRLVLEKVIVGDFRLKEEYKLKEIVNVIIWNKKKEEFNYKINDIIYIVGYLKKTKIDAEQFLDMKVQKIYDSKIPREKIYNLNEKKIENNNYYDNDDDNYNSSNKWYGEMFFNDDDAEDWLENNERD